MSKRAKPSPGPAAEPESIDLGFVTLYARDRGHIGVSKVDVEDAIPAADVPRMIEWLGRFAEWSKRGPA